MHTLPEYWLLLPVKQDDAAMDGPNTAAIKVTSEFLSTLETARSIALLARSFMPEFDSLALQDYEKNSYVKWLTLDEELWTQNFIIEGERDENRNVVGDEEQADWVLHSDVDEDYYAKCAAKVYEARIKIVPRLETEQAMFWLTATDASTGIYYTERFDIQLLSDPTFYGVVTRQVEDADAA